jgi:lipoate-protein ligase A
MHDTTDAAEARLPCLLLPYETADGPANMALDEALLDWVAEGDRPAVLRTYGWTVPSLSLGYFQRLADARGDPRWASVPVVRRPTGGGAIWHEHEVTYALVIPAKHPVVPSRVDLYRLVHAEIAKLIVELGGKNRPESRTEITSVAISPTQNEHKRPFLCFTDRNPHDIVIGGFKVAGSAQRRRAGAVLQHGSVLLAGSDRTPELRGIRNVAGVTLGPREWSEPFLERIPGSIGLRSVAAPVPEAARARSRELEGTVYRNPQWTALRP